MSSLTAGLLYAAGGGVVIFVVGIMISSASNRWNNPRGPR